MANLLLFDPYIFNNWQTTLKSVFALPRLCDYILDSISHSDYVISRCEELELEYEAILAEATIKKDMLTDTLIRLIRSKGLGLPRKTEVSMLDVENELNLVFDSDLPPTHQTLITMATQNPQVVIILAEPEQFPSLLYERKDQVCTILKREAFIYLSDFTSRLKVFTEGETDWKHLKAALRYFKEKGLLLGLQIDFDETVAANTGKGDSVLLVRCENFSLSYQPALTICIFDRDKPEIISKVSDPANYEAYKYWGKKVYSFAIPVPNHEERVNYKDFICIELYYLDNDLKRKDKNGRRLFLSTEFKRSGRHISEKNLTCKDRNKYEKLMAIIDNEVIDDDLDANVALPKNKFADYILNRESGFCDVDFSAFMKIFETINHIRYAAG